MADGVAVTPGTGVTIATKDASTGGDFVSVASEVQVTEVGVVEGGIAYARPQTGTLSNVSASATSVTLLSASGTRKGFRVYNDSASAVYIKYGTTASTTSFTVRVEAYGFYSEEDYGGRVDAIWTTATGTARVTGIG